MQSVAYLSVYFQCGHDNDKDARAHVHALGVSMSLQLARTYTVGGRTSLVNDS